MKYPSEPEVGVGALLLSGGRVLLVRRSNQPGRGKWSVPGGHLELGEGIYEAAVRELMEETGIRGRPLGVVGVSELIERDGEGRVLYHYVLVDVLMEPEAGSRPEGARAGSDAMDVAFVDLESALRMDLTDSARGLLERASSGALPLLAVSTWSGRAARSDGRTAPIAYDPLQPGKGWGRSRPRTLGRNEAPTWEWARPARWRDAAGGALPLIGAGRAAGGDPLT